MNISLCRFAAAALCLASLNAQAAPPQKPAAKTGVLKNSPPAKTTNAKAASASALTDATLRETSAVRELKILRRVPTAARSRNEIKSALSREMNRQTTSPQIRGAELFLRTLALAPRDFQLRPFYLNLLSEQVAGYYDPRAGAFYTASWVDAGSQKLVAVHELTHALQDQHFNLGRLQTDLARADSSDAQLAAMALIEGDAMHSMILYLKQRPLEALKMMGSMLKPGAVGSTEEFNKAPRSLRESLLFPYQNGMQWAAQLHARGGWKQLNSAFKQLPLSTEHILHLDKFLKREKPVAVRVNDIKGVLGNGWRRVDDDNNGEWGFYLVLDEFLKNDAESKRAAAGWGGDRYAVYEGEKGACVVAMQTAWDSRQDANEFFQAYGKRTAARAAQLKIAEKKEGSGLKPGRQLSLIGDASVFIEQRNNRVLVIETFNANLNYAALSIALWKP